jgi:hypothetical protein
MILITIIFVAYDGYNDAEAANVTKELAIARDTVQQVYVQ